MNLTADIDDTVTTIPVDEGPPAWLVGPFLAWLPATGLDDGFELIRMISFDPIAGTIEVVRGVRNQIDWPTYNGMNRSTASPFYPTVWYDDQGTDDIIAAPHLAGETITPGVPIDWAAIPGAPLARWTLSKAENSRLAKMQREATLYQAEP